MSNVKLVNMYIETFFDYAIVFIAKNFFLPTRECYKKITATCPFLNHLIKLNTEFHIIEIINVYKFKNCFVKFQFFKATTAEKSKK